MEEGFEEVGAIINSPQSCSVIAEMLKEVRKDASVDSSDLDGKVFEKILFGAKARVSH
jgi:hypothetical protein